MSDQEPDGPLPRRVRSSHLEPQLTTPWSAGSGTPFAAFEGPDVEVPDPAADHAQESARIAAAFHEGTERGRAATED